MAPDSTGAGGVMAARAGITLRGSIALVGTAAVLRVAQDVFLPLSIAMLIAFALSPLVTALRRAGCSLLWAVLGVTALAFAAIALFCLLVFGQLAELATNLPSFQRNILLKLDELQGAGSTDGLLSNALQMMRAINSEIGGAMPAGEATTPGPMVVQVVEPMGALALLQTLVMPVVGPLASAGLVVVLVIFMLMEKEALRDRFIRLVGSSDLHRSTQVLGEAGARVASYLLMQLAVNAIYALPIGIGLWVIGVPNPALWGLLTLILRFVPYIGSVLAAAFPLFLAFAVAPGWSAVLWTLALFAVVELITASGLSPVRDP